MTALLRQIKRAAALLTVIALSMLVGCAVQNQTYTATGFYFDTVATFEVYASDPTIIDELKAECERFDALFSRTREESDIWRINHAKGAPVVVSADTAELISNALMYCAFSQGVYDITVAPLTELWSAADENGIPSDADIQAAAARVDYRNVRISDRVVTVPDGVALDLGGAAKGYIADKLAVLLRAKGVKSAIINLGGNVYALGEQPGGGAWRIGIRKPFSESGESAAMCLATNESVVTAGVYERGFSYQGAWYHHIIDTDTGRPAETDVVSATVIAKSSLEADVLSTICVLSGADHALELISQYPECEALIIDASGVIIQTIGFNAENNGGMRVET